jgi:hypothetical protein
MCTSCNSDCAAQCTGTSEGVCTYCSGGCEGCGGTCGIGCEGSCSGCGGSCSTDCTGCTGCGGACSSDCSGCSGSCSGSCDGCNGCSGSCDGGCDSCDGCSGCSGTCSGYCDSACTAANTATLIASLGSNIVAGNKINLSDFKSLRDAMNKELTRRYITPADAYSIEPVLGGNIIVQHPQKAYDDINRLNTSKYKVISAATVVLGNTYTDTVAYIKTLMNQNLRG